jgi:hypothetical protein
MRFRIVVACALLLSIGAFGAEEKRGRRVELGNWVIEQMPGGTAALRDGALVLEDEGGCTAWWKEKIAAPVEISYEATFVTAGGPHDRLSDLNCFWMAREAKGDIAPFASPANRLGKFAEYDSLLTYYVGYGGNNNSTTRFRRYDGTAARPLRPEHDLSDKRVLLEPNRAYRIKLVARDGKAEYYRDGERIFEFTDPEPLKAGWFAIRTVRSHLVIKNLKIERLKP